MTERHHGGGGVPPDHAYLGDRGGARSGGNWSNQIGIDYGE